MDQLTEMILSDQELLESHPLYKKGQKAGKAEGHEEGREEGALEGQEKALREATLAVLQARFGAVPEDTRRRLQEIHALAELKTLVAHAARSQDIESFRQALGNAAR